MRSNPQLGVTDRNGFGLFLPFLSAAFATDCHGLQPRGSTRAASCVVYFDYRLGGYLPHLCERARVLAVRLSLQVELFTTLGTVEVHLTRIYRKVGLRSRAELSRQVAEGTLDISDSWPPCRVSPRRANVAVRRTVAACSKEPGGRSHDRGAQGRRCHPVERTSGTRARSHRRGIRDRRARDAGSTICVPLR